MQIVLDARRLVDWISASLASPGDLALPDQLVAATIFILAVGGLILVRLLARQARPLREEHDELDEAA
jgi:hypothetical protein